MAAGSLKTPLRALQDISIDSGSATFGAASAKMENSDFPKGPKLAFPFFPFPTHLPWRVGKKRIRVGKERMQVGRKELDTSYLCPSLSLSGVERTSPTTHDAFDWQLPFSKSFDLCMPHNSAQKGLLYRRGRPLSKKGPPA